LKQQPIPWPKEQEQESTRAGEKKQPALTPKLTPEPNTANQPENAEQIMVANGSPELDGPAFELRP
jgi:hypothetical protein